MAEGLAIAALVIGYLFMAVTAFITLRKVMSKVVLPGMDRYD